MTLSLNEVEALAKKAVRGAGYPWGIAEETGKAVRWLCTADVDGCAPLAEYLTRCGGADLFARSPVQGNVWSSSGDCLCPLLTGAALSDMADTLKDRDIRLESVSYPILLAPFAGLSARQLEATVVLEWDEACVATDGKSLAIQGETATSAATVTARIETDFDHAHRQSTCTRAKPDEDTLAALNRLAHRTYAPATEASRLSGAGAGLSDND